MMTPREALDQAEALLLDFDGPMAQLMPPPLNRQAADLVRQALGDEVPPELADTTDHIALLAHPGPSHEARLRAEQAATEFEIECAKTCEPAPWLPELLSYAKRRKLPLAVVTNNNPEAVRTFLTRPDTAQMISVVCGRTPETINALKPDPRYLAQALCTLHIRPEYALFVGDSTTDMLAGTALGLRALGYAKNSVRAVELEQAGAESIFRTDLEPLSDALASSGPAAHKPIQPHPESD